LTKLKIQSCVLLLPFLLFLPFLLPLNRQSRLTLLLEAVLSSTSRCSRPTSPHSLPLPAFPSSSTTCRLNNARFSRSRPLSRPASPPTPSPTPQPPPGLTKMPRISSPTSLPSPASSSSPSLFADPPTTRSSAIKQRLPLSLRRHRRSVAPPSSLGASSVIRSSRRRKEARRLPARSAASRRRSRGRRRSANWSVWDYQRRSASRRSRLCGERSRNLRCPTLLPLLRHSPLISLRPQRALRHSSTRLPLISLRRPASNRPSRPPPNSATSTR
jgi:hypothetical protein